MIYSQQLQFLLMSKFNYKMDSGNVIFTNITSKYLPSVSSFLSFWDKHITITNDSNYDDEYEIDELTTLYKIYDKKNSQMSDINMIKMICHYFSPQVEVIDNKYITNIKCNLWCKQDDIQHFLQYYKVNTKISSDNLISFDDLYQSYKIYFNAKATVDKKTYPIVSKQFFEKFILTELTKYIKFDKFVSSEWVDN
jgi:hypothetical protein